MAFLAKVRRSSVVAGSVDRVGKLFWVLVVVSGLAQEAALCLGACAWLRCCRLAWLRLRLLSRPWAAPRRCCLLLPVASAGQMLSLECGFLRAQAVARPVLRLRSRAGVGWGSGPAPWLPSACCARPGTGEMGRH